MEKNSTKKIEAGSMAGSKGGVKKPQQPEPKENEEKRKE